MKKKTRKKLIIITVVCVVTVVLAVGGWLLWQYREDQKTVEVVPVSYVADSYWGSEGTSSGMIVSDYLQEIYPDSAKVISEIYVQEGDVVSIGTPLLQYDKESLELEVEARKVAVQKADLNLSNAQTRLKRLQNTKASTAPTATPKPTKQPVVTSAPTAAPTATPTPTPTPIPPADVTLYSRLDLTSVPYSGSGTADDPYVFLCTSDCIMTQAFLRRLLGIDEEVSEPESSEIMDDDEGEGEIESEPTTAPTATPTTLRTPFAAIFEVREGDSNYGELISAFQLDGTQMSANFAISSTLTGGNTIESIAGAFGASPSPTSVGNYNDMGYTSAELKEMITEVKEEIQSLQVTRRQAELDLNRAELALKNSTVLSTVDGTVRTLLDEQTAKEDGKPFLVVSGESTYYVSGAISENALGSVQVGDYVTVNNYMTGNIYNAQIVSIADYPLDSNSDLYYYGDGNPNSSTYEFSAVLEGGEDLQNGQYVDIQLTLTDEDAADALYIQNAYLREDDAGTYVMKVDRDGRLKKQYVSTGRSLYGYSLEVKSGLTIDDYIAFPYGADVKEGVRAVLEGTDEAPDLGGGITVGNNEDANLDADIMPLDE